MAYDIQLALMCGTDIAIPECQLVLHQPTMREIALIGDLDFLTGIQTLCINKKMLMQDETLLSDMNNFQIFMTIMQEKEVADKKEAVKQVLLLLFPDYQLTITPRSLLFIKNGDSIMVDETNFEALQQVLFSVFCINSGPMEISNFNPQNKKAQEIAEKLMKARQRVAAQKPGGSGNIFTQYISVLTVGLGSMSLNDCTNLTMYQLFDLVERYMLFVNWDIDIRSRLAGGKPDKQPDNWMQNIH